MLCRVRGPIFVIFLLNTTFYFSWENTRITMHNLIHCIMWSPRFTITVGAAALLNFFSSSLYHSWGQPLFSTSFLFSITKLEFNYMNLPVVGGHPPPQSTPLSQLW